MKLARLEGRLKWGLADSKEAETELEIENAKEEIRALEAKMGSLNAEQQMAADKVHKQKCSYVK